MRKTNRLVSVVILVAFIFNTAVSGLAFGQTINYSGNSDKLAPPSRVDDIAGLSRAHMSKLEITLEALLLASAGSQKLLNESTVRAALGNPLAIIRGDTSALSNMVFSVIGASVAGDHMHIECKIKEGSELGIFYAVISLKCDDVSKGFPIYMYTASQYEDMIAAILTLAESWLKSKLSNSVVNLSNPQNPIIIDITRYRQIMPQLAYEAANNPNPENREAVQNLILRTANQAGAVLRSIGALYRQKAALEESLGRKFTIPSMNLRCAAFDEARIALVTAQRLNAGALQFEIAPTEVLYTGQTHQEFSAMIAAAAIAAGYTGPVFIKLDHLRMDPKKYAANKEAEIQRIFAIMKDAINAGFRAIDIDASVLEKNPEEVTDPVEQQRDNFIASARLVEMTRVYARERGIELALGVEVGEVGEAYITEKHIRAFLGNLKSILEERSKILGWDIEMPDVLAIPTGTPHGGLRDPSTGQALDNVTIAFDLLQTASTICREYGMVGPVQHGASKLPVRLFDMFPAKNVTEIHLATAMSDIEIDLVLPEAVRAVFLDEFVNSDAAKSIVSKRASDNKEPFTPEALRKNTERRKLVGKHKSIFWRVPTDKKDLRKKLLGELFEKWFELLGVRGTLPKIYDLYKTHKSEDVVAAGQRMPAITGVLKQPLELIPDEWLDGWLTLEKFVEAVKLAGYAQAIDVSDDKSVLIFSEKVTFGERTAEGSEEGIGILLPNFVKSGVKVAVIGTTEKQRKLIEVLNEGKSEGRRIVYANSLAEVRSKIPAARYCYFKVASEADAGIDGILSITIIVKKIIDAIGKTTDITNPKLIQRMHEAARRFAISA